MPRPPIAPAAVAAALAVALACTEGSAGPTAYDISPLLAEPHPFADTRPALPEVGTPLYDSQIRAPARFPQPSARGAAVREAAQPSLRQRTVQASAPFEEPRRPPDPALMSFNLGWFDFNDDKHALELRLEWRGAPWRWGIRPLLGVMATSDTAVYGFGGLALDVPLGRRIVLTPSFAAGLYQKGDGKDLGSVVEFRSALELGWRFDDSSRVSIMVYHLSNAGIDDVNPGTEVISIGYAMPF